MISFECSKSDGVLIERIVFRARGINPKASRTDLCMSLKACVAQGTKLRLSALLAADDFSLLHDVYGIHAHIDKRDESPTGGMLLNNFRPRFTA